MHITIADIGTQIKKLSNKNSAPLHACSLIDQPKGAGIIEVLSKFV